MMMPFTFRQSCTTTSQNSERNNQRDILSIRSFSVYINGFNDGQQDYRFYVSAAGVQMDCIATEDGEFSWDAIWDSEVSITDFGWVVEMNSSPLCDSQNQKVKHGD
jgi:hypothetical protein